MDKKNLLLGILFILSGFAVHFYFTIQTERERQEFRERQLIEEAAEAERRAAEGPTERSQAEADARQRAADGRGEVADEDADELLSLLAREVDAAPVVEVPELDPEAGADSSVDEAVHTLQNDYIEATFTSNGGALRHVNFKQTKRGGEDYFIFNEQGYLPALSLSLARRDGQLREFNLNYEVTELSDDAIEFTLETGDLRIVRRYSINDGVGDEVDPYVILHGTTFENTGDSARELANIYLNVGTSLPTLNDKRGTFLNAGYFDGDKARFIGANRFTSSSGFLGIGSRTAVSEVIEPARIEWASVKNQFFTSVLSSTVLGNEIHVHPVNTTGLGPELEGRPGVTATVGYAVGSLQPGERRDLDFQFYVGPKEYIRLQRLGNEEDLVMQFGFLSFFSKLLMLLMYGIHSVVPSWGWSIVIMTIILKLIFWPLTAKAAKSQKRMSKIQEPMKALKEKYKDDPKKMQQETIRLFREAKVNPAAGCLPILIQMPIFIGLFYMLRTASELRYEPFLWVQDLSAPDTLLEIGGFPVNLLPILMGVSMFFQMRMMPSSPNMDPLQQKIFRLLPAVFIIFLYNFASGLVLYWTVQNLLTILQQWLTNRRPDEELDIPQITEAKGVSNKAGPKKRPARKTRGNKRKS